jgi:hypothetical protein
MDTLNTLISYASAFTATWNWYVIGGVTASILTTIGVTAWVKRHHLKQTAEKLRTEFIILNVGFWGYLTTTATFILTNGLAFGGYLPFVGAHWAQISGGAIAVHALASSLYQWFVARKDNKPLIESKIPETIQAAATDIPALAPLPAVTADLWADQK